MTLSKPLRRSQSLHAQTYQVLRTSILAGELAPGERLVETQLAEQLQVSRTPLREAMRQLQREELVTADPGGGLRVTAISREDAVQLYDCRIALESLAVVEACTGASASGLKKLEQCVKQAETLAKRQLSEGNSGKLLELDYQFHRLIAETSGNKWLLSLLEQVFDKMALLRSQTTRHNPGVLEIRTEHRKIYDAIAKRDTEGARDAIAHHLSASKARVVQEIEHLSAM